MSLVGLSIRYPVGVVVVVLLIFLFGWLALAKIPVQLTPNVDIPRISVETRWLGRSPEEVEKEITYEQERFLKNVEGVVKMTSESSDSQATITLEFAAGADMSEALVRVQNALARVPNYPDDVDEPVLSTSSSQDNPIAWFVLKSSTPRTQEEIDALHDFLENDVKPVIERRKGVARSNVIGGREREMRVEIDSGLLAAKNLTFLDVRDALARDNENVSGGDFDLGKRRMIVRVVGEFTSAADIAEVVIARRNDVAVRVKDIGLVRLGLKKSTFSVRNGAEPAIALNVMRANGSNVLEVMREVDEAVETINATLLARRDLSLEKVYDETEYIDEAIARVNQNILWGSLLTAAVLFFFLRSVSGTLITCTAIPICAAGTFLAVTVLGRTINVIMLAGISFAVGMVVDSCTVVIDNVQRRRFDGASPDEAARIGASEVFGAVFASSATTMAVFLPVIFDEGEVAQLFRDIAIAICAGIGLSMVVAVTVIPSFMAVLMRRRHSKPMAPEGKLVGLLARGIARTIRALNRSVVGGILFAALLTGGAIWMTKALMPPSEYLPTGNRNLIFGILLPPPGYNLAELERVGKKIEGDFEPLWTKTDDGTGEPGIRDFFFVARGRSAFMGASAQRPDRLAELLPRMQRPLSGIPGMIGFVQQTSLFGRGLGEGRTVDIDITGGDLTRLVALGGRVFGMTRAALPAGTQIRPIPSLDIGNPEVRLVPDRARMSELGLRNRDLGFLLDAAVDGSKVSEFRLDGENIDLSISGSAEIGDATVNLENLAIVTRAPRPVTLGDVAKIVHTTGPEQVNHVERDRVITIQVSPPQTLALETAVELIRDRVIAPLEAEGALGGTTTAVLRGTADELSKTKRSMVTNFLLALVITYLLLTALYSSFVHPLVILFTVPLAAAGGVLGLFLLDRYGGGQKLDVVTMLGFIILIGTVVNNAILIVDLALVRLRERGMSAVDAAADAVKERTNSILNTVLTTVLGTLPLAVAPGAGSELYRGLGAVVVGGLTVSTVFTFFLIPTLFILVERTRAGLKRIVRRRTA